MVLLCLVNLKNIDVSFFELTNLTSNRLALNFWYHILVAYLKPYKALVTLHINFVTCNKNDIIHINQYNDFVMFSKLEKHSRVSL